MKFNFVEIASQKKPANSCMFCRNVTHVNLYCSKEERKSKPNISACNKDRMGVLNIQSDD